jgi:flagellar protein FliO/FliZ
MMARRLSRLAAALLAGISLTAGAVLPTVSAAPEPVRSFGMAGFLQAGLGLAAVLGLIVLCGWGARRLGLRQPGSGRLLKVVASTMVGQRERVVVVEVGGAWLVLGVAAGQVSALHTMPAQIPPDDGATSLPGSSVPVDAFSSRLQDALVKLKSLKKQP